MKRDSALHRFEHFLRTPVIGGTRLHVPCALGHFAGRGSAVDADPTPKANAFVVRRGNDVTATLGGHLMA
jgi:hypothetical protein